MCIYRTLLLQNGLLNKIKNCSKPDCDVPSKDALEKSNTTHWYGIKGSSKFGYSKFNMK